MFLKEIAAEKRELRAAKRAEEKEKERKTKEITAQERKRLNKEYEPIMLARRKKWDEEHPEEVARREKRKNAISNKPKESFEMKQLKNISIGNKQRKSQEQKSVENKKECYEAASSFLIKICTTVLDKNSFEKLKARTLSKFKNTDFDEKLYREIEKTDFEDLDFSKKENGRYNNDVFEDIFPFIRYNPFRKVERPYMNLANAANSINECVSSKYFSY